MTIKAYLILSALVLGYLSFAWYSFGAVHPCDILVARQNDHQIVIAEKHHQHEVESLKEAARKAFPKKDYERFVQHLDEYSSVSLRKENQRILVVTGLRQKARDMSLSQCAWQAITWQPPGSGPAD